MPLAGRRAGVTDQQPLVLIVDGTDATRRLMRRALEKDRLRVIETSTGEEALRMIRALRPNLVILDQHLPEMSGLDVARELRANDDRRLATTPILACAVSTNPDVRQEALDAGCDAFEAKPLEIRTLAGRIRELIAQSGQR